MPTPLEKREKYHKDIMSAKKDYEAKDKAHSEADVSVKKAQEHINKIKRSIDEIEAKLGKNSKEAEDFRLKNEPLITELERKILYLETDRKENKIDATALLKKKEETQLLRNKQEEVDGTPNYIGILKRKDNEKHKIVDNVIDTFKKTVRKFREDVSTSTQKKVAALGAAAALFLAVEKSKVLENHNVSQNPKDNTEKVEIKPKPEEKKDGTEAKLEKFLFCYFKDGKKYYHYENSIEEVKTIPGEEPFVKDSGRLIDGVIMKKVELKDGKVGVEFSNLDGSLYKGDQYPLLPKVKEEKSSGEVTRNKDGSWSYVENTIKKTEVNKKNNQKDYIVNEKDFSGPKIDNYEYYNAKETYIEVKNSLAYHNYMSENFKYHEIKNTFKGVNSSFWRERNLELGRDAKDDRLPLKPGEHVENIKLDQLMITDFSVKEGQKYDRAVIIKKGTSVIVDNTGHLVAIEECCNPIHVSLVLCPPGQENVK